MRYLAENTEKAVALFESGVTYVEAAKLAGIPASTLYAALRRRRIRSEKVDKWERLKAMLRYTIEHTQDRIYKKPILESVLSTMEAIDKADLIA